MTPPPNGTHPHQVMTENGPAPNRYESPPPTLPPRMTQNQFDQYLGVLNDQTSMTRDALQRMMDPRRDLEQECGYPLLGSYIGVDLYKQLYDRDPIAARVVECVPMESWKVPFEVLEDDDEENVTEFEQAWDDLANSLAGGRGWFQDEKGSKIWSYLLRADICSRIGHFGIILLGLDDGKELHEPVDGMIETTNNVEVVRNARGKATGVRITKTDRRPVRPDSPIHPSEEKALLENGVRTTRTKYRMEKGRAVGYEAETVTNALSTFEQRLVKNMAADRERLVADLTSNKISTVEELTASTGPSLLGTDAQYFGPHLGQSETPAGEPSKKRRKLLFMRPYDESLVQVVRWEWNVNNPRFGHPVMYRVTLNDPREATSGVGLPLATVFVHWTRVVHVADNKLSSDVLGKPALQQVLNNVLGLRKIYHGDPEAYWRGCFTILTMETHPQLGGDVDMDVSAIKDDLEQMQNGSQRTGVGRGLTLKSTAPTVVDPTPHVQVQLTAICVKIGVPTRVFMGSEQGKLAADQDTDSHDDRMDGVRQHHCIPDLIVPLVDRLIMLGVLPEPETYMVRTPEYDDSTDKEKADIGLVNTQMVSAYVAGGVEAMIPPEQFMTSEKFLGMSSEEAEAALDAAEKAQQEKEEEQQALAEEHGMIPQASPGFQHPEPPPPEPGEPAPVTVKPGEKLVHPVTGKDVAQGNPFPKKPTTNRRSWHRWLTGDKS